MEHAHAEEVIGFPMARAEGCPFDPPPDLAQLSKEGAITRVRNWDGSLCWLVTRYDEAREVLSSPDMSAETHHAGYPHMSAAVKVRRSTEQNIMTMDNPQHDIQRRLISRFFTLKQVNLLRPRIQAIVDEVIDDLLTQAPPVDIATAFALRIPSTVICDILGMPHEDQDFFSERTITLMNHQSSAEEAGAAHDDLRRFIEEFISTRDDHGDTLTGHLVALMRSGQLTSKQVVDTMIQLVTAGHETTSNMLALGTLVLLQDPARLAEIRDTDDPEVLGNAVDDLLRYLTVSHVGRRRVALKDIEIGGQLIAAGEGIIVALDIANRDPHAFEHPDELDFARSAHHHLAFSYGIHQCLGQSLARAELQIAYQSLFRRIPSIELAVPLSDIRFRDRMIIYGVWNLPATWETREAVVV
ncbi:cytochrome P450 [Compostimonas suwonensis]|nr:cytochrome P450 [Compostimonas suwonensis]